MSQKTKQMTRWLPLLLMTAGFAAFFYFGFHQYLNFDSLKQHHAQLQQWTASHYFSAAIIFMLIYIVTVATSIPGATILTLVGGFLFGISAGTTYVVISATFGAALVFLAVRTALGRKLAGKASSWAGRMELGFQHNAFSYMLFLRFIPIFPFWIANIVPALLNVRLSIFMLATFIGIIPGSLVYVLVGHSLSKLANIGKTPSPGMIFSPEILMTLLAFALLSLMPVLYKKMKRGKDHATIAG